MELLDHAAADRLVEGGEQLRLLQAGRAADDVELELGPGGRSQLEQVGRARRQAREPLADDLANALRGAELGQRPRQVDRSVDDLDPPGLDQRAPQLADQERVALGEVADRPGQLGGPRAGIGARGPAHELGDLLGGQAGEPQPHDVVRPAQVGERLRERLRHVGLGVAEGGEEQQARAPGAARQVAEKQERRGVGPVPVLDHEQHRALAADSREQVGDRRVQPVALGVRIGLDRGRQIADPGRQVGEEARELAASGAERARAARRAR